MYIEYNIKIAQNQFIYILYKMKNPFSFVDNLGLKIKLNYPLKKYHFN